VLDHAVDRVDAWRGWYRGAEKRSVLQMLAQKSRGVCVFTTGKAGKWGIFV